MISCRDQCHRFGIKTRAYVYFTKETCRICVYAYKRGEFKRCPCCGFRLSSKPINSRQKEKYLIAATN